VPLPPRPCDFLLWPKYRSRNLQLRLKYVAHLWSLLCVVRESATLDTLRMGDDYKRHVHLYEIFTFNSVTSFLWGTDIFCNPLVLKRHHFK
jgi:hypothetical protein